MLLLAAGEAILLTAGRGRLAGPRPSEPTSWPAWLLTRPPDVVLVAMLRWAGIAVGAYLLAVTTVGVLVRLARMRALVAATDVVTPTSLRRLLDRLPGMAAAGAVVVGGMAGCTGVAGADPAGGPPTTRHGPPITLRGQAGPKAGPFATTTTMLAVPTAGPVALEPVPPPAIGTPPDDVIEGSSGGPPPAGHSGAPGSSQGATGAADGALGTGDGAAGARDGAARGADAASGAGPEAGRPHSRPADPAPTTPASSDDPVDRGCDGAPGPAPGSTPPSGTPRPPADGEAATWEVEPGDHFWSIARCVLADQWGRQPSTVEIDGYWRTLVATNRARLADPGNPDLLFAGQVLTLPPVPVRPAA